MSRLKQADQQTVCRCGTPTRDGASTCEGCLTSLYNLLTEEVPWLDEQLDVSISGQRAVSLQPGQSTGVGGVLLNQRASAALRRLNRVIDQWVKFCLEHDVRNSAPNQDPPHERAGLTERAQWLSWRVDGLAWWPSAYHAKTGIEHAVDHAREVVLWKPPVRVFLGKCSVLVPITSGELVKIVECQGDVYAARLDNEQLADKGYCRSCSTEHWTPGMREKLEAELDGQLCTAAEIARMMVYLGADGDPDKLRERVRKRINQWQHRGVIAPTPCDATRKDGEPRYRFGSVKSMLAVEYRREKVV